MKGKNFAHGLDPKHSFLGSSPINACLQVRGSEVNLRIPLHASEGIHTLAFKPRADIKVQNRGISGPTKRTYVLQFFFKKESIPVGCVPTVKAPSNEPVSMRPIVDRQTPVKTLPSLAVGNKLIL